MKYRIEHESKYRIRIKLLSGALSDSQAEILRYVLQTTKYAKKVSIFKHVGSIAIEYDGKRRKELLERLDRFNFANVDMMADELEHNPPVDETEIRERHLTPALKRKLRVRIAAEAAADLLLPTPIQLAYHAYQFVSLKEL